MIDRSYLIVACSLQGLLIAHLAVLICIARNRIQGITIGQLCLPECLKLFGTRLQFELGGKHLFHRTSVPYPHRFVKCALLCEVCWWQFLPASEDGGLLATSVDGNTFFRRSSTRITDGVPTCLPHF